MNAYNIPGPGDAATWGNSAGAIGSPLRDEDPDDTLSIEDEIEACREAREWVESAEVALKLGDVTTFLHRIGTAMDILRSLKDSKK